MELLAIVGVIAVIAVVILIVLLARRKSGDANDWKPSQIAEIFDALIIGAEGSGLCSAAPDSSGAAVNAVDCFVSYADSHWSFSDMQTCIAGGSCSMMSDIKNKLASCFTSNGCKTPPSSMSVFKSGRRMADARAGRTGRR